MKALVVTLLALALVLSAGQASAENRPLEFHERVNAVLNDPDFKAHYNKYGGTQRSVEQTQVLEKILVAWFPFLATPDLYGYFYAGQTFCIALEVKKLAEASQKKSSIFNLWATETKNPPFTLATAIEACRPVEDKLLNRYTPKPTPQPTQAIPLQSR